MPVIKRLLIVLAAVLGVFAIGFAVVWFVPSVQDTIVKRILVAQIAKADRAWPDKDEALHILFCGTGSPIPDPTRAGACTAIIAGGQVVIIDTGPGSWAKLARANVPAAKVDTVLLTHLHSDHIGDLGEVAVQSWIGGRTVPLEIYGPPAPDAYALAKDAEGDSFGTSGTEAVVKGFAQAYNSDAAFRIVHHLTQYLPPEGARMIGHDIAEPGLEEAVTVYDKDGLKIAAFLVAHDPAEPAYGYRIDYKGRAAVVSGDTKKVQNIVRFAKGADVLVHEALNARMVEMLAAALEHDGKARQAKMTRDTIDYHTTPAEAAGIADEAGVPLLVLTHLMPPLPNALMRHMFLEDVSPARGKGDTMLARDGLVVTLPVGSKDITTKTLW
jgi:ribonuclease Z